MLKIGSIYNSNSYGAVEILDCNESKRFYLTKFILTGTEKIFREDQILSGSIRDPYAAKVCGVGKTGNVKTKGKNHVFYSIWHDMINRCYCPNDKRAIAYENVLVDDRWLTFENFLQDVSSIEGYDEEAIRNGKLVLDKDIKQRRLTNKLYSKDTCCWVAKSINAPIQDHQQRPFVATDPNGIVYYDDNISKFAREHGLERRQISGVLHERCKTTRGWHFQYQS